MVIFSVYSLINTCLAVQVDGYCFLQNQSNHTDSKVLFEAASPSAVTDSTCTDSTGYYDTELSQGVYDIYFTHEGYYGEEILNRLFMSNTTLQDVTLTQIIQNELSGALSGNLPSNTYLVVGNIFVQSGDSLFIQPSTVFQFDGPYAFDINGYLTAVGTESDSIKFMLSQTATEWSGIDFNDTSSDSSLIKYCYITGSDSSGIYCNGSSPTIDHCNISGNSVSYTGGYGGGICIFENSDAIIVNCIISGNSVPDASLGGGIFIGPNCSPTIDSCIINGNVMGSDGRGAAICCYEFSSPTIMNCSIEYNSTNFVAGFGGAIECMWSSAIISHCNISHNSTGLSGYGGGIDLNGSNVLISHCVISSNSTQENPYLGYGGGIACGSSSPIIDNCTISSNSAGSTGYGGGIYVVGSSNPSIFNTIMQGNIGQGGIFFDGASVNAFITYCDFYGNGTYSFAGNVPEHLGIIVTQNANGDPSDIYYNIFLNPQLVNPSGGNYHLQSGSPCIDAGDPTSPLDPDSTITDLGAFYFDQLGVTENPNGTPEPSTFQLFPNYPNPFNPTTTISYYLPHSSEIQVDIYNLLGQLVETLFNGRQEGGVHLVRWDASNSPSGIYFVQLQSQNLTQTRKMVLLK